MVAGAPFRSGCLKLGSFRIKSGVLSPFYVDLAGLLSHPRELTRVAEATAERIKEVSGIGKIDRLASVELVML